MDMICGSRRETFSLKKQRYDKFLPRYIILKDKKTEL
jgi:hypothetical protein